jgi:hypothetical protein
VFGARDLRLGTKRECQQQGTTQTEQIAAQRISFAHDHPPEIENYG